MYRKIYSHANSIRVMMMMMTYLHDRCEEQFQLSIPVSWLVDLMHVPGT